MPAEIDLANLNGQVMNLPQHQSAVASDVLGLREEYILVSINRKEIENLYKEFIHSRRGFATLAGPDIIHTENTYLETQSPVKVEVKAGVAIKKSTLVYSDLPTASIRYRYKPGCLERCQETYS